MTINNPVHDGAAIMAWQVFRDLLNVLGVTDQDACTYNSVQIDADVDCVHVTLKDTIHIQRAPFKFYALTNGMELYQQEAFKAFCKRIGFAHDLPTIKQSFLIEEGMRPEITQVYAMRDCKEETKE